MFMRPRFALATRSLNQPLRAALKTAATMQAVKGIRIDARQELRASEMSQTGKRQLLHLLREYDLQLTSLSFSARRAYYDPVEMDHRVSATREAMDLAALLQVQHLCVRIGTLPESPESQQFQVLREIVNDLVRYGNHIGVTLTIIPGAEEVSVIEQFLGQIKAGPIALDFDPARMVASADELPSRLRALHSHVVEFTARDAVRDFSGGTEETQLGRGEVIWDELIATLAEADYQGWITLLRTEGESRRQDVENSLRYLQRIFGEF